MLPHLPNHDEYLAHVNFYTSRPGFLIPLRHAQVEYKLKKLDLSALRKVIEPLYSRRGRPARNPQDLLRSLMAMVLCGYTSIDQWVSLMRSFPYYAVISGFSPKDVPGVGTFFEFMDRLSEPRRKRRCSPLSPKAHQGKELPPSGHFGAPGPKDTKELSSFPQDPRRDLSKALCPKVGRAGTHRF